MFTSTSLRTFARVLTSVAMMSSTALAGCADEDAAVAAPKRALFVVSNPGVIPAPGGGERDSGVWFSEVTHPYWALRDAGDSQFQIDIASPDGGRAAIDGASVKLNLDDYIASGGALTDSGDPGNERFLSAPETSALVEVDGAAGAARYTFKDTLRLADVASSVYDVVFYAGGNPASFQFPGDEAVHRVAAEMYDAGKLVTAVCHGTAALLDVELPGRGHLVAGKDVTGFSTAEEDMLGQRAAMPLLLEEEFPKRGARYTATAPFTEHVVGDGRLITGQNPTSGRGVGAAIVRYFAE